jgi:magnesium chelatase family protein
MLRGQDQLNGKLEDKDISKYCTLEYEANEILNKAIANYSLSFRSINKVLKVARTIADIDGIVDIQTKHLLESLSYRKR